MKHIIEVADRLKDETSVRAIQEHITWFTTDILKMLKNIKETSMNDQDKSVRLKRLSDESGIPLAELTGII